VGQSRFERLCELTGKPARIAHVQISHWPDFFRLMNFFARRKEGGWQWVFRGQKDSTWGLQSSLEREIEEYWKNTLRKESRRNLGSYMGDVVRDERRVIGDFQRLVKSGDYLPAGILSDVGESLVQALSMLQHYGSKTRLLDFTYSLGVAAYFAFETQTTGRPRTIWALNIDSLVGRIPKMKEMLGNNLGVVQRVRQYAFGSRDWPEDVTRDFQKEFVGVADGILEGKQFYDRGVIPIRLVGNNRRLDAQNGLFLFPLVASSFEENLAMTLGVSTDVFEDLKNPQGRSEALGSPGMRTSRYKDHSLLKIDFMPEMESRAWHVLEQMQLVPHMLFPDLDGLAKGMRVRFA